MDESQYAKIAETNGRSSMRHHIELLFLSTASILLSFLLVVRPDQRVAFCHFEDYPIPETCIPKACLGISCPACGLTRSLIYLAQGNLTASLRMHRLGWLLAAVILFQVPYRLYAIVHGDLDGAVSAVFRWFGYFVVFLLIANWIVGICAYAR
jgi:hypothetical protein